MDYGNGNTESWLEVKKDEEQIFIHAQKNQDIRVNNSHFETIGNEHHLSVGTNRFEFVKENDHRMVDGETLSKVKGNVSNVFEADVMQQTCGNENYKVDGDRIHHVGTEHLKADQNIRRNQERETIQTRMIRRIGITEKKIILQIKDPNLMTRITNHAEREKNLIRMIGKKVNLRTTGTLKLKRILQKNLVLAAFYLKFSEGNALANGTF